MTSQLPALLLQHRHGAKLTQAQLASKLGVRQQMIARWEKGESVPSASQITQLEFHFGLPDGKWAAMTKGKPAEHGKPDRGPARPLHGQLPLDFLGAREFERFTLALSQAYFPEGTSHMAGGQGHRQNGADVIASDTRIGKVLFQCKRVKAFGVGKFRKAAEEGAQTEAQARILVLSKIADPALRKEAEILGWEIWDHDDIVFHLQQTLKPTDSKRIIWAFFPAYLQPILGFRDCGPWLTPDEFFAGFLNNGNPAFSHKWDLIGRDSELGKLVEWTRGGQELCILSGPAGIGKTRLLLELTACLESESFHKEIYFVDPTAEVRREDFEALGDSNALLIIDDSHARNDLESILRATRERMARAKTYVLLATRPHKAGRTIQDLAQFSSEFPIPKVDLKALADSDAVTLASNILGIPRQSNVLKQLVSVTKGCTLLLIAGCVLLKNEKISLAHLGNAELFRTILLENMYEDYAKNCGPLPGSLDPQSILQFIAAVQPFNLHDQENLVAATSFFGMVSISDFIASLDKILETGAVIRRGSSITIQPDLLADHILANACYRSSLSSLTKFEEGVWDSTSQVLRRNLTVNLAKVDWHLSATGVAPGALLGNVWGFFQTSLSKSDIPQRIELLGLLKEVAYYQPEGAISLIRWTMDNEIEDTEHFMGSNYDYQEVYLAATLVLRNCAFTSDTLEESCNLLWQICQQMKEGNSEKESMHPAKVLVDLAGFSRFKPTDFSELVVNRALVWLHDNPTIEALDIVDEALKWEVRDSVLDENTIHMTSASTLSLIGEKRLQALQRTVLAQLLTCLESKHLDVSVRIVKILSNFLQGPIGVFGRKISPSERDFHITECEWVLNELFALDSLSSLDPIVHSELESVLAHHTNANQKTIGDLAQKIIDTLPDTLDRTLSNTLKRGLWGNLHSRDGEAFSFDETKEQIDNLVLQMIQSEMPESDILDTIEYRLLAFLNSKGQADCSPSYLLQSMVHQFPSTGISILNRVLDDPQTPFRYSIGVVIGTLRNFPNFRAQANELSVEFLQLKREDIACEVASSFSGYWNAEMNVNKKELDLVHKLAIDERSTIALQLIAWLSLQAKSQPQMVVDLLLDMRIGRCPRLADRALSLFSENEHLQTTMLSKKATQAFCDQITACDSIGGHWVGKFLNALSVRDFPCVIEMLKQRVVLAETERVSTDFRPLPFRWDDMSPISAIGSLKRRLLLDDLRDWASVNTDRSVRHYLRTRLFGILAGEIDLEVLESIECGLESELDRAKLVTRLIAEFPAEVVWENSNWIIEMLEKTSRRSRDLHKSLRAALHQAVTSGIRHGVPGEPFPEDLEQYKQAKEIAARLVPGSAAENFYRALQHSAEDSIARSSEDDWI